MSDPIRDLKQELLAAAERRHEPASARTGGGRARALSRRRVLLVAATLSIAAALGLFLAAPWSDSPGFLERARAAVTPPAGAILHERLVTTVTSKDFGCTVTTRPTEIWVDQAPPHRWRVRGDVFLGREGPRVDPRTFACATPGARELGGSSDAARTLELVLPNTLTFSPRFYVSPPTDARYASTLREAIASGIAHDEGTVELDGRSVQRIRFDSECPDATCPGAPSHAYVDSETFHPVKEVWPSGYVIVNPDGVFRFDVVVRYLTFEYLPRTDANVALTDIRAQHPDAKGP